MRWRPPVPRREQGGTTDVQTRNEAVVRRLFDNHNRGPEEFLARLEEIYDPDIRWTPAVVGGLESRTYHGYDGWRRYYADRAEVFGEGKIEVISCDPIDEDVIVAHIRSTGVGRGSGLATEHKIWSVSWFRNDRILRQQVFTSRTEAYEAAGA
jgi:ketosteroid isomerase-like protein